MRSCTLLLSSLVISLACTVSTTSPSDAKPDGADPVGKPVVEAPPEDGGEAPATDEGPKGGPTDLTAAPAGEGGETGPSCTTDADCPADNVCEGKGCGEGEGVCAPKTGRMCTRDLREYCGCDGKTFQGSGSCPGGRYSAEGACG